MSDVALLLVAMLAGLSAAVWGGIAASSPERWVAIGGAVFGVLGLLAMGVAAGLLATG